MIAACSGRVQQRRTQQDSLFRVFPLRWLHNGTDQATQTIYENTGIKLGLT